MLVDSCLKMERENIFCSSMEYLQETMLVLVQPQSIFYIISLLEFKCCRNVAWHFLIILTAPISGTFTVQFYDGVIRCLKRMHIKAMPEDAKGQVRVFSIPGYLRDAFLNGVWSTYICIYFIEWTNCRLMCWEPQIAARKRSLDCKINYTIDFCFFGFRPAKVIGH